MIFSIDHQSTSNDRLKPVMTTGLVNMHINWPVDCQPCFKRASSDQKGHSKRMVSDQKGHINFAISVVA